MANILGIKLSELNREAALEKADEFLNSNKNHFIVTPNPEIILAAHDDEEFFHILNQADLSLADGMGLKIAGLLMQERIYRLTGADFTLDLLNLAAKKNYKTLILNWSQGKQLFIQDALRRLIISKTLTQNDIDELVQFIGDIPK